MKGNWLSMLLALSACVFIVFALRDESPAQMQRPAGASIRPIDTMPARYSHNLSSMPLDAKGVKQLVVSNTYGTALYKEGMETHSHQVTVLQWGKPFTTTYFDKGKNQKAVLTVTLYKVVKRKSQKVSYELMKALYSHTIYEKGKVKLKFSGQTMLYRWGKRHS